MSILAQAEDPQSSRWFNPTGVPRAAEMARSRVRPLSRERCRPGGVSTRWRADRGKHRDTEGTETDEKEGVRITNPNSFCLRSLCALCASVVNSGVFARFLVGDGGFAAQLLDQGGTPHAEQASGFLLVPARLLEGLAYVGVFGVAQKARQIYR